MKKFLNRLLAEYKKREEIINYLIIGGVTTLVSLGTKYALLFTVFDASNPKELQLSIVISWVVAVLFAYVANRKIVFKSKSEKILNEMIKFFESRIFTLLFEMIFMWFFITLLKFDTDLLVIIFTLVCQIVIVVMNYLFSKLFVFKKDNDK